MIVIGHNLCRYARDRSLFADRALKRRAFFGPVLFGLPGLPRGLFTLFSPRLPESVLRSGKAEGARCSCATRATDSAFVPNAALPPASMQANAAGAQNSQALRVRPQTAPLGVACRSFGITKSRSAFVPDTALPPASMQASARLDWHRLGTNRRGENRVNRP